MAPELNELAWRSWCAEGQPVTVGPEHRECVTTAVAAGVATLSGDNVTFADKAFLAKSAATHVITAEAATFVDPKAGFQRLQELWTKDKNNYDLAGNILALLHNDGVVDAFASAHEAIQAGVNPHATMQVLEQAIPLLEDLSAKHVLRLFVQENEAGPKIFAGALLQVLKPWLTSHRAIAEEIRKLYETTPTEKGGGIYACALHALLDTDFSGTWELLKQAATSSKMEITEPALRVLSLVDFSAPERSEALHTVIAFCRKVLGNAEHPLSGTAVAVLGHQLSSAETEIAPLLQKASATTNADALNALATLILKQGKVYWDRPWFWPLVLEFTKLDAQYQHVLGTLDMALGAWVKDPVRQGRAIEFLNQWIVNQTRDKLNEAGAEKVFDSLVYGLVNQTAFFSDVITRWLLHEDRRFPQTVHHIFGKLHGAGAASFALSVQVLDTLNSKDLLFLVRRIIGYLVTEDILFSLIFSLVRIKDAKDRSFVLVRDAILNRLAKDYPQHAIDFLKTRSMAKDEPEEIREFCADLIKTIQATFADIDALPKLKEFEPASDKRRRFMKERRRQMNEAFEAASKQSIWRQIATEIPLKGGTRTFQRQGDKYEAPMELKPMSHSVAIPMSEIFDPVGAAHERLVFRALKKDAG